jgi:hypothetical protein
MHGHKSATIHCAGTGNKVRTLTTVGKLNGIDMVEILAADGTKIEVPLDNPITYEPWTFDRGSLIFEYETGNLKICTELDTITFPNGERFSVSPQL